MKASTRPLPPWLQKGKDKEDSKGTEAKGAKPKPKPFVDGGNVKGKPNPASKPKAEAKSDPKLAGNAKGNVLHLKGGGKVK